MKLAIGTDHRGFELKSYLISLTAIADVSITWVDVGTDTPDRTDYPLYAIKLAHLVMSKEVEAGILLCGTGVGMTIAANRFAGVYCGLACSTQMAIKNKEDDNVNVLALAADYVTREDAVDYIGAWLNAKFKGGRYAERIAMIDAV